MNKLSGNLLFKLIYKDYDEILTDEFAQSFDAKVFYDEFRANGATHEWALAKVVELATLLNQRLELSVIKAKLKALYAQKGQHQLAAKNKTNATKAVVTISKLLAELISLVNGVPILKVRKRTLRNFNFHKRLISFNNL
jgi:hypothetical protein